MILRLFMSIVLVRWKYYIIMSYFLRVSSQLHIQWPHIGTLKLTTVGEFTPWKSENATHQGFSLFYFFSPVNPLLNIYQHIPASFCPNTQKYVHNGQMTVQGMFSLGKRMGRWEDFICSWNFYSWVLVREETVSEGFLPPSLTPAFLQIRSTSSWYLVSMKQKEFMVHENFSGALNHLKLWLFIYSFQMLSVSERVGTPYSSPIFNKGVNDRDSFWSRSSSAGRSHFPSSWHFRTERVSLCEALRERERESKI